MLLPAIVAILAGPLTVAIILTLFTLRAFTGDWMIVETVDPLVMYGMLGAIGTGTYVVVVERSGLIES